MNLISITIVRLFKQILADAPNAKEVEFLEDGTWKPVTDERGMKTPKGRMSAIDVLHHLEAIGILYLRLHRTTC